LKKYVLISADSLEDKILELINILPPGLKSGGIFLEMKNLGLP
jgi:hypothetical protein